ncbi:MAG: hypothetical protein HZC02_00645 [Candidatus Levybacteria bacterium]|nr:hypothetical protein [Candidatus Levybacteria bacterium]
MKGGSMCYNCGCDMPDDDMGLKSAGFDVDGKSITTKTFQVAADSQGMTLYEAMEETYKLLGKELRKTKK